MDFNVRPLNAYDFDFRVYTFGENLLTGQAYLFSLLSGIPEKDLSLNLTNTRSMDKVTNVVYLTNGEFGCETSAEELVNSFEYSLKMKQDYSNVVNSYTPSVKKNLWESFFIGGIFTDSLGNKYSTIGINGQRWLNTISSTIMNDLKYVMYNDGLLKHPAKKLKDGSPFLDYNGKSNAFNNRPLYMVEIKGEDSGYRIAYNLNIGNVFEEDIMANTYSFVNKRLCDVFDINRYLIDGITNAQDTESVLYGMGVYGMGYYGGHPDVTLYRIGVGSFAGNTRVIYTQGTTKPTTITNGTVGDIFVFFNTSSKIISVNVVLSATTFYEVAHKIGLGCKIFSNYDGEIVAGNIDLSNVTESYGLSATTQEGYSGAITGSDFFIDSSKTGSSIGKCYFYDFSYTEQCFVRYNGE
jgi:hypothetical protein